MAAFGLPSATVLAFRLHFQLEPTADYVAAALLLWANELQSVENDRIRSMRADADRK